MRPPPGQQQQQQGQSQPVWPPSMPAEPPANGQDSTQQQQQQQQPGSQVGQSAGDISFDQQFQQYQAFMLQMQQLQQQLDQQQQAQQLQQQALQQGSQVGQPSALLSPSPMPSMPGPVPSAVTGFAGSFGAQARSSPPANFFSHTVRNATDLYGPPSVQQQQQQMQMQQQMQGQEPQMLPAWASSPTRYGLPASQKMRYDSFSASPYNSPANFYGDSKPVSGDDAADDDSDEDSEGPMPISAEEYTAALVPAEDDPDTPSFTVRAFLLGTLWAVILAICNSVFLFRTNYFTVPTGAATLLAYPMGVFLSKVLPKGILNPGPFSMKEHVIVYIIAGAAGGIAYGLDNVLAQRLKFNDKQVTVWNSLAWVISSQMIGYGLAGLFRGILVRPSSMLWPSNLSTVALFVSFHDKSDEDESQTKGSLALSRYTFFWFVFAFAAVWSIIPSYCMTVLQAVSLLCFFASKNARILGSSSSGEGFGVLSLTFDWSNITSMVHPITSPWFASVNFFTGTIIWLWVICPIVYFSNLFGNPMLGDMRLRDGFGTWHNVSAMASVELFDRTGTGIDVSTLVNGSDVNSALIDELRPIYLSPTFALDYFSSFMNASAVLMHVALWHGKDIAAQFKKLFGLSKSEGNGKSGREKSVPVSPYTDVPDWIYAVFLGFFLVVMIVVCEFTPFKLQWWATLLGFALATVFMLPFGIIQGVTGVQPGLNVISEFVIGLIIPGQLVPVMTFKSFAFNLVIQGLFLTSDLKLGHYLHISPIHMVIAQLYGTLIGAVLNTLTAFWVMDNLMWLVYQDPAWLNIYTEIFVNAGVIWGAIGPMRFFGPGSPYFITLWGFALGLLLPLTSWGLYKLTKVAFFKYINFPLLTFTSLAGFTNSYILTAFFLSWYSQWYLFNKHRAWWAKYNYVFAIAMDTGTALTILALNGVSAFAPPAVGVLNPPGSQDYYCFGTYQDATSA